MEPPTTTRRARRADRRRGRWSRRAAVLAAIPLVLGVGVVAAWAVDSVVHDGEVARNVELAGRRIGGLGEARLAQAVADVADEYRDTDVVIDTPDGEITFRSTDIGLIVDEEATAEAALEVGRDDFVAERPLRWLVALASPREAPVVADLDRQRLRFIVAGNDPTGRQDPEEPSLSSAEGEIAVSPGSDGRGLDSDEVAEAVLATVRDGELPVRVTAIPRRLEPRFELEDAERLAAEARALTSRPLLVEAGGSRAEIPEETLRTWMRSEPGAEQLELVIDEEKLRDDVTEALPDAGERPVDAGFRVEGGVPVLVPGRAGTTCCADGTARLVIDALRNPSDVAVSLPLHRAEPERTTDEAEALGIVEQVASFSTSHPSGQPRVRNIHRIADLTRGVIIEPGESFSVNGFVGRRTRDKGFVAAPVIYRGEFTEDVGGGVSQYATTLFNAAFFAGLEIPEYQSHSIYISRYPYGREATLSYPNPDLVIRNQTPYGVLLWPTYTESSITVSLYSTKHIEAQDSGQTRSDAGRCTRVTTRRTRTWLNMDKSEVDQFYATYRPGEGVDC